MTRHLSLSEHAGSSSAGFVFEGLRRAVPTSAPASEGPPPASHAMQRGDLVC
jgi:hypothetical protein